MKTISNQLRMLSAALSCAGALLVGACAPSPRLWFPDKPVTADAAGRAYRTRGDGPIDFRVLPGADGHLDTLWYDDDEDGTADRTYRLRDYPDDGVPHLIILFDSIPYAPVEQWYHESNITWFAPPQRVIPPFPTMSPVIFSRMVGAPPQRGAINQHYDRATGRRVDRIGERVGGDANPWELRLDYRLKYWQNGLAFLEPRDWFHAELAMAKAAFDASTRRVTIVYFASTACMLSKYGRQGLQECLDGLEQLSLQILYERCGAVKISATADHGHNLSPGTRIDLPAMLKADGFSPVDSIDGVRDVVIEQDGLVNYVGIHTRSGADVASALAQHPEFELTMHVSGERVLVQSASGTAAVEYVNGRYRYAPLDADVLEYAPVLAALSASGKLDSEGFASAQDWFHATIDHRWPDAPVRLWEAFHGVVVNTPDVMAVTRRGYYVGLPSMDWFIDMASTHGGLDQDDSATFLLTTTQRANGPLRTEDLLKAIEPSYNPDILRRAPD